MPSALCQTISTPKVKPMKVNLATLIRRLLASYAIYFNKRHKRAGHLFQNRYASLSVQGGVYFLELLRYIHLNPLKAGIVKSRLEAKTDSGEKEILLKKSFRKGRLILPSDTICTLLWLETAIGCKSKGCHRFHCIKKALNPTKDARMHFWCWR